MGPPNPREPPNLPLRPSGGGKAVWEATFSPNVTGQLHCGSARGCSARALAARKAMSPDGAARGRDRRDKRPQGQNGRRQRARPRLRRLRSAGRELARLVRRLGARVRALAEHRIRIGAVADAGGVTCARRATRRRRCPNSTATPTIPMMNASELGEAAAAGGRRGRGDVIGVGGDRVLLRVRQPEAGRCRGRLWLAWLVPSRWSRPQAQPEQQARRRNRRPATRSETRAQAGDAWDRR